jgi:hypothetical protein
MKNVPSLLFSFRLASQKSRSFAKISDVTRSFFLTMRLEFRISRMNKKNACPGPTTSEMIQIFHTKVDAQQSRCAVIFGNNK